MKRVRIWAEILSPALLYLAAQLILTACMKWAGMGEQAEAAGSCLLVLPVVYCFFKFNRGEYLLLPIRPFLPWAAAAAVLLLINGTVLQGVVSQQSSVTLLGVLGTAVCAPISEELIYRGLVCSRSEQYLGFRATMVISSVLFGIAHTGLQSMAWAAVFGAVFYLMRCSFDTLLAPIAAHILLNLAAFLF